MYSRLGYTLCILCFVIVLGCSSDTASKSCCPGGECGPKVQVVVFSASWCAPCKAAKPFLARIQAAGVEVVVIDIDQQPEVAKANQVTSVPTFFVRTTTKSVRTQNIAEVIVLVKAVQKPGMTK